MSSALFPGCEIDADPGPPAPSTTARYHALDWVRVVAMFLGVFYHLPIAFMGMGMGMGFGPGMGMSPKTSIDNWLHSFRMPLFFLISGFFASMMLEKYGVARYLARRWWRIGAPLLISIFAFAGFRYATSAFAPGGPPGFGYPPAPAATAPVGPAGGFGTPWGAPRGAPGTTSPPTGNPWGGPGPGGPPGFGPPGGPAALKAAGPALSPGTPWGPPIGGHATPSMGPVGRLPTGPGAGNPAAPALPAFPTFQMPPTPTRTLAEQLFGTSSWFFNLEHLWFLWYLIVFSTIAPLVAMLLARIVPAPVQDGCDRLGRGLIRFQVVAPVLGLVAVPALIHGRGFIGWSLANPVGFLAPFPDFLFQYYPDAPLYFLYFLGGWWLHRVRDALPGLGRGWLWSLALGIAGFAASQWLSNTYSFRPDVKNFEGIRLGGFALYSLGTAYTSCAFLGFFQRYLDRPTRIGRYLADTILWVYLIHLPLIPYLLFWIQPGRGPWWVDTLAGIVVVAGVTLALFELIVRPTPLVYIFGPPRPRPPRVEKPTMADGFAAGPTLG